MVTKAVQPFPIVVYIYISIYREHQFVLTANTNCSSFLSRCDPVLIINTQFEIIRHAISNVYMGDGQAHSQTEQKHALIEQTQMEPKGIQP